VTTNPYKLKTTFKHLLGVSIGKYKKAAFMEYAGVDEEKKMSSNRLAEQPPAQPNQPVNSTTPLKMIGILLYS
jgi:hypothetical protein